MTEPTTTTGDPTAAPACGPTADTGDPTADTGGVPAPELVLAGLRDALTAVLDPGDLARIDLDAITAGTPLLSLPVDSLALLGLMTQIEDRFRVYIPEERAYQFGTVGEVIDFVRDRAAARAARRAG